MTTSRQRARNRRGQVRAVSDHREAMAVREPTDRHAINRPDPFRHDWAAGAPDRHADAQRLKLTCPGCGRPLGAVIAEESHLQLRPGLDQDAAHRAGVGHQYRDNEPATRPYELLVFADVGASLAWRCPNTATTHSPRPKGLVPTRELLALVETIRATPGPATLTVAASRPAIAEAITGRAAGALTTTQLAATIRDGVAGWARSWEYDGPATWARAGHTVPDAWAGDPAEAQRHRDALAWADQHIGTNDKPTWWHHRDKATRGARLRAALAATFWPGDPGADRQASEAMDGLDEIPRSSD